MMKPFVVKKERGSHPEGKYSLYFFKSKIYHDGEFKFKYYALRYGGEVTRFQTREDAKETAFYMLGM